MRLLALHRKLLRDLRRQAGPALAVVLVTSSGILAFVSMRGAAVSIREARDGFYARARFAHAFATVVRAPMHVRDTLARVPGVTLVEARVAQDVVLDVPGLDEPGRGRLLSLPGGDGHSGLNVLTLRRGALPEPTSTHEVVVSEAFALAHGFEPGDTLGVLVNGRRRALTIVGIGTSPEFIYAVPPGGVWPDDRRYGVLWMPHAPLAAWLGFVGAFNDVVFTLAPDVPEAVVLSVLERVLSPWGGGRVRPQRDQLSYRFVDEELQQLDTQTFLVPLIFLGVAAFILHMVLVRLVDSQRETVGLLKAVGYSDVRVVAHYVALALIIVGLGAALGLWGGAALGDQLIALYRRYFRFDVLAWRMQPASVVGAVALSALAGGLGAASATRRIMRLQPAVAMQPPAPPVYARRALERARVFERLSPSVRMVVRHLWRRPARAAFTVVGIGFAVAIVVVSSVMHDAVTHLIDLTFLQTQREDVEVALALPRPRREVERALARLPGVLVVEPTRALPVVVGSMHRRWEGALETRPLAQHIARSLRAPLDVHARLLPPHPDDGLVITDALALRLAVSTGDLVSVERLDGDRRRANLRVVGTSHDLLGLHASIPVVQMDALFPERSVATGALLLVESGHERALAARLKQQPNVAGASFRKVALETFRRLMAENMAVTRLVLMFFSSVIAVGIVYNSARIALAEQQRDLATLCVLGLARSQVARMFLGEQLALVMLGIPCGWLIGYGLTALIVTQAASSEIFRIPILYLPSTVVTGSAVVLGASLVTALGVRRRVQRFELVHVLKERE